MVGSKWVRDFCYGAFGLTPDPADYAPREPDLGNHLPADRQPVAWWVF